MNIPYIAYKFRLDYGIFHMPLEYDQLVYILRHHFRILRYSEAETELLRRECYSCTLEWNGFALTDEFGQTTIYISDYVSREKRLLVLLHELGHVLCGHCRRMGPLVVYGGSGEQSEEEEANEFSLYLRAPICYFAKLHVQSPEDIRAVAGVGKSDAQQIFREVIKYRQEDHLITRQEKNLLRLMCQVKDRPFLRRGERSLKRVAATACIALALILGICCCAPYLSFEEDLPSSPYDSVENQNIGGRVPVASAKDGSHPFEENSQMSPAYSSDNGQKSEMYAGQETDLVWITRSGECYHREGCQHLGGSDLLWEVTFQEAVEMGLRPCKVCHPDEE